VETATLISTKSVDHVVAIDDGVDNWLVLEGDGGSLDETRHEAELDVVSLQEALTEVFSELHVA